MTDETPIPPVPPSVGEAEYRLEMPLKCHHCGQNIMTVLIVRLLRERVNFVSTLPRRGLIIICSSCHGILSAEVGGMA